MMVTKLDKEDRPVSASLSEVSEVIDVPQISKRMRTRKTLVRQSSHLSIQIGKTKRANKSVKNLQMSNNNYLNVEDAVNNDDTKSRSSIRSYVFEKPKFEQPTYQGLVRRSIVSDNFTVAQR